MLKSNFMFFHRVHRFIFYNSEFTVLMNNLIVLSVLDVSFGSYWIFIEIRFFNDIFSHLQYMSHYFINRIRSTESAENDNQGFVNDFENFHQNYPLSIFKLNQSYEIL